MTESLNKEIVLEKLKATRADWEALVNEVGPERMELRGVTGEWSVKDLIAHLTAWEVRAVAWLAAVRAGTWPQPPDWPTNLDEDGINAWIWAANRGRRVADVTNESRQVFDQLVDGIEAVPEQDLSEAGRFAWLRGGSLAGSIGGNTFEHYEVHSRELRSWLDHRAGVTARAGRSGASPDPHLRHG